MSEIQKLEEVSENLKKYLNINYQLFKLEVIECSSVFMAATISYFIIGVLVFLSLFFASIWLCLYISEYNDNYYSGFIAVAVIYLSMGILLLMVRRQTIDKFLRNKFIKIILKK